MQEPYDCTDWDRLLGENITFVRQMKSGRQNQWGLLKEVKKYVAVVIMKDGSKHVITKVYMDGVKKQSQKHEKAFGKVKSNP